jgi:hypothetical protein
MIVVCAVLLFAILFLVTLNMIPWWPVSLALTAAVTVAFAALYWLLFGFCTGITMGQHLAQVVESAGRQRLRQEQPPRFR